MIPNTLKILTDVTSDQIDYSLMITWNSDNEVRIEHKYKHTHIYIHTYNFLFK